MEAAACSNGLGLFGEYLEEREGVRALVSDHAFLSYSIVGEQFIVRDLFCRSEHRKLGFVTDLWDKARFVAEKSGCKQFTCAVHLPAPGSQKAFEVAYSHGFRPVRAEGGTIILAREV